MEAAKPTIEFLWWEGCPSWDVALERLREQVEAAGLDPAAIELHEIETEPEAAAASFAGSPTIRVAGRDIQPPGSDEPAGLNCRVYRTRDGRVSPVPDAADIRDALAEAIEGDRT